MTKLTHAQALKRAGLPTLETLVRRILRSFDAATPSQLEAGALWYDSANKLALTLACESSYDVENVAAVIAHLSPRTSWALNVAATVALVKDGVRLVGTLAANYDRAALILDLDPRDVESTFKGPKTRRFYRNILGDRDAVTVDVWAARVVGIEDENTIRRVGVYDAIERAYQLAAGRRGVDPVTVQATTWIIARNGRVS